MAKFKEGDLARIIDAYLQQYGKNGDVVKIVGEELTYSGKSYVRYKNLSGTGEGVWATHRFEPYTPAAGDTFNYEGAPYVLANRKAEVGEKVIICDTNDVRWKNGEIFTLEESGVGGAWVKHPAGNYNGFASVLRREYLVLEPKSALEPVSSDECQAEQADAFSVGDIVEIVANKCGHDFKIGEKVRISEVRKLYRSYIAKSLQNNDTWCVESDEIRISDPDEYVLADIFAERPNEVPTYTLSQLAGKTLRISVAEDTYEGVTTKVTIARDVEDGTVYVIDVEEEDE